MTYSYLFYKLKFIYERVESNTRFFDILSQQTRKIIFSDIHRYAMNIRHDKGLWNYPD